ncbi:LysR substrate-binding domain-containing protein [Saccharopolyspora sp. NPDC050389]|uniref:LysR substrate-binding domain-containing protein n=1 Tax=Saccharopolyspora sp. NPDC050389 TaxID=3155516 RepID=UPI00340CBAED
MTGRCGPIAPRLIDAVNTWRPAIRIDAQEGWSLQLDGALSDGGLDLVVSHTLPDRVEYGRQPLRQEAFTALVGAGHAFAGRQGVSLRDFAGQTFRFYKSQLVPAHHATLMAALRRPGREVHLPRGPDSRDEAPRPA